MEHNTEKIRLPLEGKLSIAGFPNANERGVPSERLGFGRSD